MATIDLTGVSLLSVDLFDTLLLRRVPAPEDVFALVGARARATGLLQPRVTRSQFQAVRRLAEQSARVVSQRDRGHNEVTLQDIYAQMPDAFFRGSRTAVARLEVAVEGELVYAHPEVLALLHDAVSRGIPVVAVSDTYFNREELGVLLRAAAIPHALFNGILPSSEFGASKHEGTLFAELLARYPDVPPHAILHLGDNPRADVAQARAAGLAAVLHDTGAGRTRDVLHLEALRHGNVLPQIASLRRLASTIDTPADAGCAWAFTLGSVVLGPVLAAFAEWVVAECARDGLRVIRPLMREGALFRDLILGSARAIGADLDVSPLYASRASTWLASLRELDTTAIQQLLQRRHLTVSEALAAIDVDVDDAGDALSSARDVLLSDAAHRSIGSASTVLDALVEYLHRSEVRDRVNTSIERARGLLSRYLDQECGTSSDVALVDLGFHGSTGRAIELADASRGRRYHQFLVFGAEGLTRLWPDGHDARVFAAGPGQHADLGSAIARHPGVLEALLMDGGSTVGYRQTADGQVVPVLDAPAGDATQWSAARACRAGIRTFQRLWLAWKAGAPALAQAVVADRRGLTQPVHRLIVMPTSDEAAQLGPFLHEDNYGGRSAKPLADFDDLPADVEPAAFLEATLSAAPAFGRMWNWPAGVCERRWPGYLEARWRQAAGSGTAAPPAMPLVAMRMRQSGVRQCVVWGTGEAGIALLHALRHEGIEVLFMTDSNPKTWGTVIEGVPVVSPEDARSSGNHVFAIGSCAFAADIEAAVRRHYAQSTHAPQVFSAISELAA